MNTHVNYSKPDSILPLPRRAVPYPDEDLLSIIRRSASHMGYADLRWLLRPEGGRWDIKSTEIPLLLKKEQYHVLQRLLLLSEEQLYNQTLHRFAPLFEDVPYDISHGFQKPPQQVSISTHPVLLSSHTQKSHFLHVRSIRVCPLCLQEQECYDRLYWRMQLILYCPHHRVLLQEKCPACEAPIPAHRQNPYSCPSCHRGDYRTFISTPIASDHPFFLGELLFLKALDFPIAENTQSFAYLARSPLFTLSNKSYIRLFRTILSKLEQFFSHQELVLLTMMLQTVLSEDFALQHVLPSTKRVVAFLLFHWLFLEWPAHLSTFLDVWYSISTPPYTGEKPEHVNAFSRYLFCDPRDQDSSAWLHQAYQHHHQQFRYDPVRTDHLREKVNQLAQLVHQQQTERNSTAEHEPPLYVPPRLLTHTLPYPWESLTSALSRAAKNMNHPCPERLLDRPPFTPCTLESFSSGEPRLPSEADDPTLAHLLQIPRKNLQYLSCSHLVASLGLPPYDLSRQWIELPEPELRSWLFPSMMNSTTKVCPYCVREPGGYDRLYWNLRGVLCCPLHKVRLLERCPSCLHHIPAVRSRAGQCPFCQREIYMSPTEQLLEDGVLIAGTSLLLTMLHIPPAEASSAYKHFAPSPLLTVKPGVYFTLLIGFTEEIGSYYAYSQQQLLRLCRMLDESTPSSEQPDLDPYAPDAEVLLFHTLFSHWPVRFFAFLDIVYRTVHLPLRPPGYMHFRWRWLLTTKWTFITPRWLFDAFEKHEQQYMEPEDIGNK